MRRDGRHSGDTSRRSAPSGQGQAEELDLELVDRVLIAASEAVDGVDIVVLPESAVPDTAIEGLEAFLQRHGVKVLVAGVRQAPTGTGELTSNWVHIGVSLGGRWWHPLEVGSRRRPLQVLEEEDGDIVLGHCGEDTTAGTVIQPDLDSLQHGY